MFVLFIYFMPFDMSILDFTDCKCCPYVYQAKDSLLSPFEGTSHHGTLYHSKCAIFMLSQFLTIAYDISFSSSLFTSLATFI